LTDPATSAVTPCDASSTLLRIADDVISDRYTACVVMMPPAPKVLSTDKNTIPQKFVT
jgi:hypothetical protein